MLGQPMCGWEAEETLPDDGAGPLVERVEDAGLFAPM